MCVTMIKMDPRSGKAKFHKLILPNFLQIGGKFRGNRSTDR